MFVDGEILKTEETEKIIGKGKRGSHLLGKLRESRKERRRKQQV